MTYSYEFELNKINNKINGQQFLLRTYNESLLFFEYLFSFISDRVKKCNFENKYGKLFH